MDSELLYGDIESAGKDVEIEKLQGLLDQERKRSETLETEVQQLKEQIKALVTDRAQLETNMMSLYNTAKIELKRKDGEITSMRSAKH